MPFIGNQPALSYTSFAKQDFTTSATTSYTLDNPVTNENEIALFINFVRQEPTTAYTASNTNLTLTSATSSSDDMYCVFLGKALQTVNPPAGSVGASQITDGSISLGKLSATGTKDATTFLRGDNTFASAGGNMTPAFEAYLSSDQTSSSVTNDKIQYDTKVFDTGGCFNNTGSTATLNGISVPSYSFAPNVAGKYFIYTNVGFRNGLSGFEYAEVTMYKNTTAYRQITKDNRNNHAGYYNSIPANAIFELNGTSDYVNIYGLLSYITTFIATGFHASGKRNYFGAYKIIE